MRFSGPFTLIGEEASAADSDKTSFLSSILSPCPPISSGALCLFPPSLDVVASPAAAVTAADGDGNENVAVAGSAILAGRSAPSATFFRLSRDPDPSRPTKLHTRPRYLADDEEAHGRIDLMNAMYAASHDVYDDDGFYVATFDVSVYCPRHVPTCHVQRVDLRISSAAGGRHGGSSSSSSPSLYLYHGVQEAATAAASQGGGDVSGGEKEATWQAASPTDQLPFPHAQYVETTPPRTRREEANAATTSTASTSCYVWDDPSDATRSRGSFAGTTTATTFSHVDSDDIDGGGGGLTLSSSIDEHRTKPRRRHLRCFWNAIWDNDGKNDGGEETFVGVHVVTCVLDPRLLSLSLCGDHGMSSGALVLAMKAALSRMLLSPFPGTCPGNGGAAQQLALARARLRALFDAHCDEWARAWEGGDVLVSPNGDADDAATGRVVALQQGLRFSMYMTHAAVGSGRLLAAATSASPVSRRQWQTAAATEKTGGELRAIGERLGFPVDVAGSGHHAYDDDNDPGARTVRLIIDLEWNVPTLSAFEPSAAAVALRMLFLDFTARAQRRRADIAVGNKSNTEEIEREEEEAAMLCLAAWNHWKTTRDTPWLMRGGGGSGCGSGSGEGGYAMMHALAEVLVECGQRRAQLMTAPPTNGSIVEEDHYRGPLDTWRDVWRLLVRADALRAAMEAAALLGLSAGRPQQWRRMRTVLTTRSEGDVSPDAAPDPASDPVAVARDPFFWGEQLLRWDAASSRDRRLLPSAKAAVFPPSSSPPGEETGAPGLDDISDDMFRDATHVLIAGGEEQGSPRQKKLLGLLLLARRAAVSARAADFLSPFASSSSSASASSAATLTTTAAASEAAMGALLALQRGLQTDRAVHNAGAFVPALRPWLPLDPSSLPPLSPYERDDATWRNAVARALQRTSTYDPRAGLLLVGASLRALCGYKSWRGGGGVATDGTRHGYGGDRTLRVRPGRTRALAAAVERVEVAYNLRPAGVPRAAVERQRVLHRRR